MATAQRPKLNKIPGSLLPPKNENHKKDLNKLTRLELLEIKERQEKLLSAKNKIAKLPDKGQKIQEFYDKVIAELEKRSNVDEAAAMLLALKVNEMEWNGHLNNHNNDAADSNPTNDILDSDDEIDPLAVIAKGTMHKRLVRVETKEPDLITEKDLEEIKSFSQSSSLKAINSIVNNESESTDTASECEIDAELINVDVSKIKSKLKHALTKSSSFHVTQADADADLASSLGNLDQHIRYVVEKTELTAVPPTREKFKPYKTTKSDVHAPEKERSRKLGKYWEVTAATPPPIQHNGAQMLSLLDSVQLQSEYLEKMKDLQEQQASERLAAKIERLELRKLELPDDDDVRTKPSFTQYQVRLPNIEGEQSFQDEQENEINDPSDEEKSRIGVTYTVYE